MLFFFNDTATTEIYTLSLHDALPISRAVALLGRQSRRCAMKNRWFNAPEVSGRSSSSVTIDRKSTRLNSSHSQISYAVFCLKKKTVTQTIPPSTAATELQSYAACLSS